MTQPRRTLLAASALALPTLGRAQAGWPTQSVRFVVPFAPGGTSSLPARWPTN